MAAFFRQVKIGVLTLTLEKKQYKNQDLRSLRLSGCSRASRKARKWRRSAGNTASPNKHFTTGRASMEE